MDVRRRSGTSLALVSYFSRVTPNTFGMGQVLTAREGDHIGQSFVLRRIGTQDVEVAALGQQATLRVNIDP